MEDAFVGMVDDFGLAQDYRIGIFVEPDMLFDKLADFGLAQFREELKEFELEDST